VSKAKQIKWNQSAQAPVYLVSGPEDFLAARVMRNIRDSRKTVNPQIEVAQLSAAEYYAGQLTELTAPSLFDEPRLVIIEGVETCTDDLIEDGVAYLADISDESTVVFRHSSGVRGKKLLDALRGSDRVVEITCERIVKENDRVAFATEEFRSADKKINNAALRALVSAFGEDTAGLAAACSQLVQDVAGAIDERTIESYFGGRVEVDNFKIVDAAAAGQAGEALLYLRHALGSGVDPVSLIGAIAHKIRVMAKIINNRSVTASQVGAHPFVFDKARRDISGWTEAGMANVIQQLAATDAAVKGAERDSEFAVERLLLLIARRGNSVA